MSSDWLIEFESLVAEGALSGFAIITPHVRASEQGNKFLQPPIGPLAGLLLPCEGGPGLGRLPEELTPVIKTFQSVDDGPDTYVLLGTRLQVVHRTDSSFYALGPKRHLGLAAVLLPANLGVLLVTFGRNTHLPVAVLKIESAARRLVRV